MNNQCMACKHGHSTMAGGVKISPGTVWCSQRSLLMGKMRQMPCFVAAAGVRPRHCVDCKRARMQTHAGETPRLGNIWCDKRHLEINKQRAMDCFE
jgi:hypothetical protein